MVYPNEILDLETNGDIKNIIGTGGLNNIMNYEESLVPPSKKNFEYKNIEKYGRIFSPSEIEKYSGKIKEICNSIINSEGIVLIYSQYLDSGIIPMSLALEEMGFTRYGSTSSLFKIPPVNNLDLNTYTNIKNSSSIPAKYTIICGDIKLTPKNNKSIDIEALTNKKNSNGDLIKVVIISKAGSEGIDFKNIRQVHVLEPWYNMSRIEQIIGRGVRNCSHIDLPFEKRNVQIFLHGTIIDENEEESCDLYIYRLAEYKAKQIGVVTRLLKEISIDCLLNKGQMNYIFENMKQKVIIKLSDRQKINYNVGHKPNTFQCDFMDSCLYECYNNNKIDKINDLTYTKNFIEVNNNIIIDRIKSLMREKFYYSKNNLIKNINIVKEYPILQIYSALSELIDNKYIIYDKYNREGYLINIDDYYYFQPIEFKNNNLSLYERSSILPNKVDKIKYNIPEIKNKKLLLSLNTEIASVDTDKVKKTDGNTNKFLIGKTLLDEMYKNYKICYDNGKLLVKSEENIYYLFNNIFNILYSNFNIEREILDELLIIHLIQMNMFNDLLNILNYIYNNELNDFEEKIKNYFDNNIIVNNDITGLLLLNNNSKELVIFDKILKIWKLANSEDYKDLHKKIQEITVDTTVLNKIVGYINEFKNSYMVFKIKNFNKKLNKGARCDQSGKAEAVSILNSIIISDVKFDIKRLNQKQICIIQEFLLRYYDYKKMNDKRWFLSPEEGININIEKI